LHRERERSAAALGIDEPHRAGCTEFPLARVFANGRHDVMASREAATGWRRLLERELRAAGLDWVRLSTERDPLHPLADFFRRRAAHLPAAS
jgi:hypothetical protein